MIWLISIWWVRTVDNVHHLLPVRARLRSKVDWRARRFSLSFWFRQLTVGCPWGVRMLFSTDSDWRAIQIHRFVSFFHGVTGWSIHSFIHSFIHWSHEWEIQFDTCRISIESIESTQLGNRQDTELVQFRPSCISANPSWQFRRSIIHQSKDRRVWFLLCQQVQ